MSEREEILTTDEVAALLKIPLATLYRWTSRGESPPYHKSGRYARFQAHGGRAVVRRGRPPQLMIVVPYTCHKRRELVATDDAC